MNDKPVVGSIVFGPVQQFEALTGMGAVIVEGAQVHAVANELAALRARVAELEKDAARYRWLRGEVHGPHIPMAQVVWKYRNIRDGGEWTNLADGPSLDAAIDAAMVDG